MNKEENRGIEEAIKTSLQKRIKHLQVVYAHIEKTPMEEWKYDWMLQILGLIRSRIDTIIGVVTEEQDKKRISEINKEDIELVNKMKSILPRMEEMGTAMMSEETQWEKEKMKESLGEMQSIIERIFERLNDGDK